MEVKGRRGGGHFLRTVERVILQFWKRDGIAVNHKTQKDQEGTGQLKTQRTGSKDWRGNRLMAQHSLTEQKALSFTIKEGLTREQTTRATREESRED